MAVSRTDQRKCACSPPGDDSSASASVPSWWSRWTVSIVSKKSRRWRHRRTAWATSPRPGAATNTAANSSPSTVATAPAAWAGTFAAAAPMTAASASSTPSRSVSRYAAAAGTTKNPTTSTGPTASNAATAVTDTTAISP